MTDDTEPTVRTDEQHEDSLPAEVREGLRDAATPLATTDPAAGPALAPDGLAAVGERLADADVVGLGEATHGTREFFELKHRLVRHLVLERGVRAVALESNLPETMALTDYVRDGEADPRRALAALDSWVWQVESVLALVEWLRAFNADRPLDDRVAVFGVGAYWTHGAVERLRHHFEAVDPDFLADVADDLGAVDDERDGPNGVDDVPRRVAAAERLVPALRDHLDEHRPAHLAATSERAWARARRYVAVVERVVETTDVLDAHDGDVGAVEDDDPSARLLGLPGRTMADNVAWVRDHADADTLVVWAHDAHLNRVAYPFEGLDAAAPSLGRRLAGRHGEDYYALGFSFARGGFQAARTDRDDGAGPCEVFLDGPLPDTVDAALHELDDPLSFVDLRAAREDDRTAGWLAESRPQFRAPGTVDPDALGDQLVEHVYADAFDGLCFVAETTRARPVADGEEGADRPECDSGEDGADAA